MTPNESPNNPLFTSIIYYSTGQRTFKAIGSGGDDFVVAMTACVEAVVGTVHTECVSTRPSATGKWISVTVGPVWVETPEQVLSIYESMKADGRLKFYI